MFDLCGGSKQMLCGRELSLFPRRAIVGTNEPAGAKKCCHVRFGSLEDYLIDFTPTAGIGAKAAVGIGEFDR